MLRSMDVSDRHDPHTAQLVGACVVRVVGACRRRPGA
jgi:hypothetical protein